MAGEMAWGRSDISVGVPFVGWQWQRKLVGPQTSSWTVPAHYPAIRLHDRFRADLFLTSKVGNRHPVGSNVLKDQPRQSTRAKIPLHQWRGRTPSHSEVGGECMAEAPSASGRVRFPSRSICNLTRRALPFGVRRQCQAADDAARAGVVPLTNTTNGTADGRVSWDGMDDHCRIVTVSRCETLVR